MLFNQMINKFNQCFVMTGLRVAQSSLLLYFLFIALLYKKKTSFIPKTFKVVSAFFF